MLSIDDPKPCTYYYLYHEQLIDLAAQNVLPQNLSDELLKINEY